MDAHSSNTSNDDHQTEFRLADSVSQYIVSMFANIAKSDMLLMASSLTAAESHELEHVIMKCMASFLKSTRLQPKRLASIRTVVQALQHSEGLLGPRLLRHPDYQLPPLLR